MAGINLSALSDYFKYPEKVAELRVRLYKILVDKKVEVDANASLNTLIDKVREVEGNIEENTIYITENNTTEGYDVTNYTKAIVDVQAQVEENELDKLLDNTIESFIMPQSINYLGPYKFYQCAYLSEIQANSLMNIESYVFYGCSNLESANLPYVTSIGYNAFTNCISLQELSVPELVTLNSEALLALPNATIRSVRFPTPVTAVFMAPVTLSKVWWTAFNVSWNGPIADTSPVIPINAFVNVPLGMLKPNKFKSLVSNKDKLLNIFSLDG